VVAFLVETAELEPERIPLRVLRLCEEFNCIYICLGRVVEGMPIRGYGGSLRGF